MPNDIAVMCWLVAVVEYFSLNQSVSPSVRRQQAGGIWSGEISLLLLSPPPSDISDNMIQHVVAVILLSVKIRAETFTIGYLAGKLAEGV